VTPKSGTEKPTVSAPSLDITNVVAAFSEENVERITGLSKGRLRYWARTGFFKPSFTEEDTRFPLSRFYSFKDVVALRTLEMLRIQNKVTLQHLRLVAEELSYLKDDLWTATALFVENGKVSFVNPKSGTPQEIVSGQYLLGIPLKKVIEDTKADIINFTARANADVGRVSRSRGINRNAWVVSGTRIPVAAIRRLHEDGYGPKEIIGEYPDLTEEDIVAALKHKDSKAA
jgi:DNA-binding transcriptional MerR regulator